jgi:ankyrin repeat protein
MGKSSLLDLIKEKAHPNLQEEYGKISLHYAVLNRQTYMCCILIDTGTNSDVTDNDGSTPFYYAPNCVDSPL